MQIAYGVMWEFIVSEIRTHELDIPLCGNIGQQKIVK